MGKYRTFQSLIGRIFRNDLNQNFEDVDKDITAQKARVDNLIKNAPQPSEVVDIRVDDDGIEHPTASERIASDYAKTTQNFNDVNESLAQTETKADTSKKKHENLHKDVKADFGAIGDGVADDTQAIINALESLVSGDILYFPKGVYKYNDLGNFKKSETKIVGAGSNKTILQYEGTGDALLIDAFDTGSASAPFINNLKLEGLSIIGNNMQRGIHAQGVSRSTWKDIRVNGSNGTDGTVAYLFKGCMLNNFIDLYTSYVDGVVPYRGLMLQAGTRAGVSVGACSNNVFTHTYQEGNSIGVQLSTNGADQNVFIGGSPEKCSRNGLIIGSSCRYNTFIATGFENLGVQQADIDDSGLYTKYINCYSSEKVLLKGRGLEVSGGYFERVEITATGENCDIKDITVNQWNTLQGGFFNNGKGTRYKNIFDTDLQDFVYKNKARYGVTVGASPFEWVNTEGVPVKVRLTGGTVTQVLIFRGTDSWEEPKPQSGNTTTQGIYLLSPGDKIYIGHSTAPTMNVIALHNL